jgi:hypothetical protein
MEKSNIKQALQKEYRIGHKIGVDLAVDIIRAAKKPVIWLFVVYFLLFIADVITTLMVGGEQKHILELNPLVRVTGSFWPAIFLNIAVFVFFWWCYTTKRGSNFDRFVVLHAAVVICFLRVFAIKNAVGYIRHPVSVEVALQIASPAAVSQAYAQFALSALMLVILALISFWLFQTDHTITKKKGDLNGK